ncbi:MAG TPA: EcsC family protein [Elainellaceae cyanobacterium]
MGSQNNAEVLARQIVEAIATTFHLSPAATQDISNAIQSTVKTATKLGEDARVAAQRFAEQSTETLGGIVDPIAKNPVVRLASKIPGINWLMVPLGQVDQETAQRELEQLRQDYPFETSEQIANRLIVQTSLRAGSIGLLTNIIPPLAIALFAVDIAAVTTLQAEMVYRIAGAYGFSLQDPARRGEVLAIFGLSVGGSGALKTGLGIIELIPGIGALVGATSNAALIYTLGYVASQFYEAKRAELLDVSIGRPS